MSQRRVEFRTGVNDAGRRIDRVIRRILPDTGLGEIYRGIRSGDIRIDGDRISQSTRVESGQTILIKGPLAWQATDGSPDAEQAKAPREGHLDGRVVFENSNILVVAKKVGELTHGPQSLADLVAAYLADRVSPSLSFVPGPVHRLDRNTSGLVMFSVSLLGAQAATEAIGARKLVKRYVALLDGILGESVIWEDPIERDSDLGRSRVSEDGKPAITRVHPICITSDKTVALMEIPTGRTHQIRVHAGAHGHPLTGDRKYGSSERRPFVLHAGSLTLRESTPALGFHHLWSPLPGASAQIIARAAGESALDRIAEQLSTPPVESSQEPPW